MSESVRRNRGVIVDAFVDPREYLTGTSEDYTISPFEESKKKTQVQEKPKKIIKKATIKGKKNTYLPTVRQTQDVYSEEQRQLRLQKRIQQLARDPNYVTD